MTVLEEQLVPRFHVPETKRRVETDGANEAAWGEIREKEGPEGWKATALTRLMCPESVWTRDG